MYVWLSVCVYVWLSGGVSVVSADERPASDAQLSVS